ncbi:hypothetical protein ABZZ20_30265 [Streptomyces sp. NPDC006430]
MSTRADPEAFEWWPDRTGAGEAHRSLCGFLCLATSDLFAEVLT